MQLLDLQATCTLRIIDWFLYSGFLVYQVVIQLYFTIMRNLFGFWGKKTMKVSGIKQAAPDDNSKSICTQNLHYCEMKCLGATGPFFSLYAQAPTQSSTCVSGLWSRKSRRPVSTNTGCESQTPPI